MRGKRSAEPDSGWRVARQVLAEAVDHVARVVLDAVDERALRRRSTGEPRAYRPGLSTAPPSWRSWPFAGPTT